MLALAAPGQEADSKQARREQQQRRWLGNGDSRRLNIGVAERERRRRNEGDPSEVACAEMEHDRPDQKRIVRRRRQLAAGQVVRVHDSIRLVRERGAIESRRK